jgi:hypothetical protein
MTTLGMTCKSNAVTMAPKPAARRAADSGYRPMMSQSEAFAALTRH